MKVLSLVGNAHFQVENRSIPTPSSAHIVIRPTYSGVCSSDFARSFDNGAYNYPLVIGHEFSGHVHDPGDSVWRIGDRVAVFPLIPCRSCAECLRMDFQLCSSYDYLGSRTDGGMSEFVTVPAWNAIAVPPLVSDQDAALLEPLAVLVRALRRLHISDEDVVPGRHLAILGAGFLGQLALRVIQLQGRGIQCTVLDRNQFKLELAEGWAARAVKVGAAEGLGANDQELASSFDFVLEASGAGANLERALTLVRPGGRIALLGNPHSDAMLGTSSIKAALRKEVTIVGSWNSSFNHGDGADDWVSAVALLSSGLRPSDLVSHWLALDDVAQTLSRLHGEPEFRSQTRFLKAVARIA